MSRPENPSDCPSELVSAAVPTPDATEPADAGLPSLAPAEIATARRYAEASRVASTQRAYASDWRRFSA